MLIRYSADRIFENKIKVAILNKGSLSLLDNFICINFVENDEPDNYKKIDVHIDEDVRLTWGTIKYGAMDISDIENQETRLALSLLDFVEKNITNEKDILDNFIDDTKSSGYLTEIIDILNDMVENLLKK